MKKKLFKSAPKIDFTKSIKYRSVIIFSVFTLFFLIFIYKAFRLQVTRSDTRLKHLLKTQLTSTIKLTRERGEILDKNLKELAISIKVNSLFANPYKIDNKDATATKLAEVLNLTK